MAKTTTKTKKQRQRPIEDDPESHGAFVKRVIDALGEIQRPRKYPELPLSPHATTHRAGSDGKLEVMRQRVLGGFSVFHPDDSKLVNLQVHNRQIEGR